MAIESPWFCGRASNCGRPSATIRFFRRSQTKDGSTSTFSPISPNAGAIAGLDPARSAPDAFQVLGQEIYLHLPNGMARTKLTNAYFDSKLSTTCTARNWATVLKLSAMMEVVISFSAINKQYGKQLIFVEASFQLNPGEKVGLVGPNGSGKTTLFRMIVGEEEAGRWFGDGSQAAAHRLFPPGRGGDAGAIGSG